MSNPITPSWKDLINKTDDELRDILIDLNKQSLRKLSRETILAFSEHLAEHQKYIQSQEEKTQGLYVQLNEIAKLEKKR